MALTYEYAVLRVTPDHIRGEFVNIGLVVFLKDTVDVRVLPTLGKVSALDGTIELGALLSLPEQVRQWFSSEKGPANKRIALQHFGLVSSSEAAFFSVARPEDYEATVLKLMERLVVPPSTRRRPTSLNTRITTTLREKFAKNKILGKAAEDISRHLVVENFPIAENESLYAEFALKNSQFHLTETADFRAENRGPKDRSRIASLAAIKFVEAERIFRAQGVKRYVIYAAKSDNEIRTQLAMLANNSDGVINLRSSSEMAAYMDLIMRAASHTHSLN